ncbi:MAG: D-alanyl-D-alanine carboxypeptidase, partial [Clostridia bacterium]|nr:D-alanyl-D-alanine carboxypeptidase [Clostridia bacterium]
MPHRLIALLLTAVLMICSPPLSLAVEPEEDANKWVDPTYEPNALSWDSTHPELLDESMLIAKSAILIEATTGEVLFEKNADEIMYPASTTKILTCHIALEMSDLENDVVMISQEAINLVPPTYATIPVNVGEEVAMKDLIAATLVRSGNEGANAIAEYISGSVYGFADLMNQTAQMLGCSSDTNFVNPSGAHDDMHYTTARDMAIIARAAMQNERFREIVS